MNMNTVKTYSHQSMGGQMEKVGACEIEMIEKFNSHNTLSDFVDNGKSVSDFTSVSEMLKRYSA